MKIKINSKTVIIIFVLSCIVFISLSLFKSSYAINNDEEFDYIFDPGQYIEYKEKKKQLMTI